MLHWQGSQGCLWRSTAEYAWGEVSIATLWHDDKILTTLAFVYTYADDDRDFFLYRNPEADMSLITADLNTALLTNCRIIHFGSLSLTQTACREAM